MYGGYMMYIRVILPLLISLFLLFSLSFLSSSLLFIIQPSKSVNSFQKPLVHSSTEAYPLEMQHKNGLKPKDPRIIDEGDSDEDYNDLDSCNLSHPSSTTRRRTGTQALVDFLNTTSPEEFKKTVPKRTSNFLFGRKKNKPISSPFNTHACSTSNAGVTLFSRHLPLDRQKSTITLKSDFVNQLLFLPKDKRGIQAKSNRSPIRSQDVATQPIAEETECDPIAQETSEKETELVLTAFPPAITEISIVEMGLRQRLERLKLMTQEKPGNVVAEVLAKEHVRALHALHQKQSAAFLYKTGVRHVQVQTIPLPIDKDLIESTPLPSPSPPTHQSSLEKQLSEEIQKRKKAEAALENSLDHFEALSGLAYKKIRELWEEKTRWEIYTSIYRGNYQTKVIHLLSQKSQGVRFLCKRIATR
ncbi:hypothetical protein BDF14DRAFT_1140635 [Spinellus fusiger]|nr:hypothetical protein BDF14DRAFT_1140635 [Spinellus fusiger]